MTTFTDFATACHIALQRRPAAHVFQTPAREFSIAGEVKARELREAGWREYTPEEVAQAAKSFGK
jgi:hypothetical protein